MSSEVKRVTWKTVGIVTGALLLIGGAVILIWKLTQIEDISNGIDDFLGTNDFLDIADDSTVSDAQVTATSWDNAWKEMLLDTKLEIDLLLRKEELQFLGADSKPPYATEFPTLIRHDAARFMNLTVGWKPIQTVVANEQRRVLNLRAYEYQTTTGDYHLVRMNVNGEYKRMIDGTVVFTDLPVLPSPVDASKPAIIEVENSDCLLSAKKLLDGGAERVGVLNMGSYDHPGGGFPTGASAQEEDMLRRTSLAVSLYNHKVVRFEGTQNYALTVGSKRSPTVGIGMIYTPGVLVFRGRKVDGWPFLQPNETFNVDFLTTAVNRINRAGMTSYTQFVTEYEKKKEEFRMKIEVLLRAAVNQGCKHLVLSALGCGAFRNPPKLVAELFKDVIEKEFKYSFERIVFAIIDDHNSKGVHTNNDTNHDAFAAVFPQPSLRRILFN
jgi:uncharacterized protein (TIGR02452 family)